MSQLLLNPDPLFAARFLLDSICTSASNKTLHIEAIAGMKSLQEYPKLQHKIKSCDVRMQADLFALGAIGLMIALEDRPAYEEILAEANYVCM